MAAFGPRPVMLRRPDPEKDGKYLYWVGREKWSGDKAEAHIFPTDFHCARRIIADDVKDAVVINA